MRLFLGSFAQISAVGEITARFEPFFDMRPTPPSNLHLTWYFLGEHPSPAPFIDRLRELKMIPRLPIALHRVDLFEAHNPRILYAAPSSPVVARALHEKIAALLGMQPHETFTPHVTLARIKHTKQEGWQKILTQNREVSGEIEPTIYLIESRLTPSGPVYLPIEAF